MKKKLLTNAELILLQIINEQESISGYAVNKLIKERNYRRFMDVGSTSVYVSLKKLEDKGYAESEIDETKQGKGPSPRIYAITDEGKKQLTNQTLTAISDADERDIRFDAALTGINYLPALVVTLALEKRIENLQDRLNKLESELNDKAYQYDEFIYDHSIRLIKYEIEYSKELIEKLRG